MGRIRYKLTEEEFQTHLIQKEKQGMDEEEYDEWLDEVERKEKEAQASWEQYYQEMELDPHGLNYKLRRHKNHGDLRRS